MSKTDNWSTLQFFICQNFWKMVHLKLRLAVFHDLVVSKAHRKLCCFLSNLWIKIQCKVIFEILISGPLQIWLMVQSPFIPLKSSPDRYASECKERCTSLTSVGNSETDPDHAKTWLYQFGGGSKRAGLFIASIKIFLLKYSKNKTVKTGAKWK